MDNYKNQKSLQLVELEQLKNVLKQYGTPINFDMYETVDNPTAIITPDNGCLCDVQFRALWMDEHDTVRCEAFDTETGDEKRVCIPGDIAWGYIGYLTEAVVEAGKSEGLTLDPCKGYYKSDEDERADDTIDSECSRSISIYLAARGGDGNLSINEKDLTLYLGGMEFGVESVYGTKEGPMLHGSTYVMEADIPAHSLLPDNQQRIIKYLEEYIKDF